MPHPSVGALGALITASQCHEMGGLLEPTWRSFSFRHELVDLTALQGRNDEA